MALTLFQQAELSENPTFKKRVKEAVVTEAHNQWFNIQRAPQGVQIDYGAGFVAPTEGYMTNRDVTILNFSVSVMNSPNNYVDRFSISFAQDTTIKDGAWNPWKEDGASNPISIDEWQEQINDATLFNVAAALFVRLAGTARWYDLVSPSAPGGEANNNLPLQTV